MVIAVWPVRGGRPGPITRLTPIIPPTDTVVTQLAIVVKLMLSTPLMIGPILTVIWAGIITRTSAAFTYPDLIARQLPTIIGKRRLGRRA